MPQELTQRQKTILDAVIREYVATAEPVSSSELVRKYRLAHSPATVRNELQELDEAGYLVQPHTSAGRVPTDKGYRFFISHTAIGDGPRASGRASLPDREERALRELAAMTDPAEFLKQTSRIFAHLTRNFVLTGFPAEELFYKWGASEVMQEPEFTDIEVMHGFSSLMDTIEDDLLRWLEPGAPDEPRTFIGRENPISSARGYGMIISAHETPFAKDGLIALIGPKRMDYEHNLSLLRHFKEMLMA